MNLPRPPPQVRSSGLSYNLRSGPSCALRYQSKLKSGSLSRPAADVAPAAVVSLTSDTSVRAGERTSPADVCPSLAHHGNRRSRLRSSCPGGTRWPVSQAGRPHS